jgi:hypothetical protein
MIEKQKEFTTDFRQWGDLLFFNKRRQLHLPNQQTQG